jgi:hypothetical protein
MGTKNDPGKFDCHAAAAPDEPIFTLRSTDPLAPILVDLWASMRERERGDDPKAREAREVSTAMRRYRLNQEYQGAARERDQAPGLRASFDAELDGIISRAEVCFEAAQTERAAVDERGLFVGREGLLTLMAPQAQKLGRESWARLLNARERVERMFDEARRRVRERDRRPPFDALPNVVTTKTPGGFTPPSGPADPAPIRFGPCEVKVVPGVPENTAAMVGADGKGAAFVDGRVVEFDAAAIGAEAKGVKRSRGNGAILCSEDGCYNVADSGGICRACYFLNPDGDGEL